MAHQTNIKTVNLNTASKKELARFPQIGIERAEDIIRFRESRGGIHSWDELRELPGFTGHMITYLQEAGFTVD